LRGFLDQNLLLLVGF